MLLADTYAALRELDPIVSVIAGVPPCGADGDALVPVDDELDRHARPVSARATGTDTEATCGAVVVDYQREPGGGCARDTRGGIGSGRLVCVPSLTRCRE